MRNWIVTIFNLFLCFLCLICCYDLKKYSDRKDEQIQSVVIQMQDIVNDNTKTVQDYKNYVDNVARCIVDGEW